MKYRTLNFDFQFDGTQIHWVPVVIAIHDDINTSLSEEVKYSHTNFIVISVMLL